MALGEENAKQNVTSVLWSFLAVFNKILQKKVSS